MKPTAEAMKMSTAAACPRATAIGINGTNRYGHPSLVRRNFHAFLCPGRGHR
jgi:hypothetical protein